MQLCHTARGEAWHSRRVAWRWHVRTWPSVWKLREVDGLAMGSSASKKSWSLELLLTLHTVVGRHCVRRTTGGSCPARARCTMRPRIDAVQAHMVWRCTAEGEMVSLNSALFRTEPASRVAAPAHVYTVQSTAPRTADKFSLSLSLAVSGARTNSYLHQQGTAVRTYYYILTIQRTRM